MFRDLDALAANRRPQPTRDEARLVAITARTLSEVLMYQPLTPFMVDFSKDFAEVLKNWNDQLVRAQDIAHYASFIARVSEDYLTMHELAQILRGFVPRMQRLMQYTPPAFDLSRHYLEMVLKRHEAGQPINQLQLWRWVLLASANFFPYHYIHVVCIHCVNVCTDEILVG